MPIKIEVYYKDGSKDTSKTTIENQFHKIALPNRNNLDIDFVLFDPNSQVLKSVVFQKFQEELINQALRAPHMLDRYDAVLALRGVDISRKREPLISVFVKEKFHAVKGEIISQLASDTNRASIDLLKRSIIDKDANVRKAVATNLLSINVNMESDLRKLLMDSSYVTVELALEKLSSKYPEKAQEYLDITKNEVGNSGRNIRVKWLEIACGVDKAKYIAELVSYTSQSYEFRTRIGAMEAVKRLGYVDEKLFANLANAASHFNSRLASPAEQCIQYIAKVSSNKKLINDFIDKGSLLPKEKQALIKNMK
jgi:hypothetical protein